MKKVALFGMVLLLLWTCSAFAETVTVPVWRDGASRNVEMVVYESPLGFSMAYAPAHFAPAAESPDTLRCTQDASGFISFQSYPGFTMDQLTAGLALQSGTDDCAIGDTVIGGLRGEGMRVTTVLYTETLEGTESMHSFYLFACDAELYGIECFFPLDLAPEVSTELFTMMQTVAFAGGASPYANTPATITETYPAEGNMVQCEVCGRWYHAGNEFRNHICVAETYPAEGSMVQCELCGQWFHEGNEFRNHICVAETYPAEDNRVETYPSEENEAD